MAVTDRGAREQVPERPPTLEPKTQIRVLGPEDMTAAARLLADVWQSHDARGPVDAPVLIALGHAGNYVAGAYEDDQLVGVCVGFFSTPLGETLHSHIAGVLPSHAGRGIGAALKHHQKAWCRDLGIERITWTFDPLVARNAYFNLRRLRATAVEYLVDFYGSMPDGLNDGQATDRMLVTWSTRPDAGLAAPAHPAEQLVALRVGDAFEPVAVHLDRIPRDVACVVGIPRDVELLRRQDRKLGLAWREATRDVLVHLMSSGRTITDFDESGRYVLERI